MKKKKTRSSHERNENPEILPEVLPSTDSARPPKESRRNFILALLSLLVALAGGIPGYLTLKSYLDRSSARIMFDQKESIPVVIANSLDPTMEGKFALLLYGVTVVGKGTEHFVAYDVIVAIRSNGIWHEGKTFPPVQRESIDRNGPTPAVVRVYVGVRKPSELNHERAANGRVDLGDSINLGGWRDFKPGIKLGFGEPVTFMVASYFPDAPAMSAKEFDRIRIVLRDYLGNAYEEEFETAKLRKIPFTLYLDQSPP